MMRPGTIIAIRSFPTDILARLARMTPTAVGGIMMARPPLPRMGPRVIGFL